MFKLGVMTDEISQDFQRAVSVCQEYHLDGVEIRSVWDVPPQDISDEQAARIMDILGSAGMTVCCIAAPFYKCDIDSGAEREEHLGILRRCCRLAHTFHTKIIRGFTFWAKEGVEPADAWGTIVEAYAEPVRILEGEDLYVGIENESSTMCGSARLTRKFIDDLGSERVQSIWDAANEVHYNAEHGVPDNSGVYPEGFDTPFPEAYERVRPQMIHMHLKDSRKNPAENDASSVRVGEGDIDYPAQLQALVDSGYEGYCSLETHWRTTTLTKEQVDRPGGAAFSAEGEPASRLCIESIKEMIAGLRT
ncbi:MAG: sugar phosphate isomerase/epimerase family protein [Armatimonadota bacterium]|jgi:sugar phosphate isomerase/epimerase